MAKQLLQAAERLSPLWERLQQLHHERTASAARPALDGPARGFGAGRRSTTSAAPAGTTEWVAKVATWP